MKNKMNQQMYLLWRETCGNVNFKLFKHLSKHVNEHELERLSLIQTKKGKCETMATVFLNLHLPTSFWRYEVPVARPRTSTQDTLFAWCFQVTFCQPAFVQKEDLLFLFLLLKQHYSMRVDARFTTMHQSICICPGSNNDLIHHCGL